jgi:NAD-dependent DNA ligase
MKRKASLVDDSDDEDTKVRKLPTSDNYSFVVGSSSITQEQQQQISKLEDTGQISISGADFASTTHLICASNDQDSCRRTLKVLFAIAKGAYLLNMNWITNSIEMGYIVEEDEYELTQKQCPGAKKARKHKQEDKPSLLIGMKIFITGSTKMEHDVLVQLVEVMGAKNVSTYKDCDVCVLGEEHDFQPTKLDKPIVNEKV